MTISTQPMGTRLGPTLMGRILPDPIKKKVEYGFLIKSNSGPGRVGSGFCKNSNGYLTGPGLVIKKLQKNPTSLTLTLNP